MEVATRSAADARFYEAHKDRIKARHTAYYKKNATRIRANTRQWYEANKIAVRARENEKAREFRKRVRTELFALLGGAKCNRCPFSDERALQIDHVHGGGSKELKAIGTKIKRYALRIKANPTAYQVLCANCNWIKRHENHEQ